MATRRLPRWMRDRHLATDVEADLQRADPLWPGQIATFVALAIYFVLPTKLTVGPQWPVPVAEILALVALLLASRRDVVGSGRRVAAIGVITVAIVFNLIALGLLS